VRNGIVKCGSCLVDKREENKDIEYKKLVEDAGCEFIRVERDYDNKNEAILVFRCKCGNKEESKKEVYRFKKYSYCIECGEKLGQKAFGINAHTPEANETRVNTIKKKYGVECPFSAKEIREKIKRTNIDKYGCENPFQNEEIKQKVKETNIKKYGVESAQQNAEFRAKEIELKNLRYKVPDGTLERGGTLSRKEFIYDGYEIYAIKKLLEEGYEGDDILTDYELCKNHELFDEFWYEKDGKKHRYFPDIYIISENKYIEVKSEKGPEYQYKNLKEKIKSVKETDHDIVIWLFKNNGAFVKECFDYPF